MSICARVLEKANETGRLRVPAGIQNFHWIPAAETEHQPTHVMKCPYCRFDNDKVIDSRASEDGFVIRRRRMCVNCEKRFTTYERVAELDLRVIKKDGARELFCPEKIRQGLERACWKRPIATHRLEDAIHEVVQDVYMLNESEISTQKIGEMVMQKLVDLDDVAYIRFASVYRQFKDIREFVEEVRPILDRNQLRLQDDQTAASAKPNG